MGLILPKRLFSLARFGLLVLALCESGAGPSPLQGAPSVTQEIDLHAGWNLIALQVGGGLTSADFQAALGDDSDKLRALWEFEPMPVGVNPAPWEWRFHRPDSALVNDLTMLSPGKGYWVDVAQACRAEITGLPWEGQLEIQSGWNLVGFPGFYRGDDEVQELAGAFGDNFERITQVWTYDASAQRFVGYDLTSIPVLRELDALEQGQGYWVEALDALTLAPDPLIALPQDADASPLQDEEPFLAIDYPGLENPEVYVGTDIRKPGAEDTEFDLNANGILDTPFTQNTLRFDVGVDRKILSIANQGSGLFNWSVEETVPWLSVDVLSGTVSTETDYLTVTVNRSERLPGRHEGTLTLQAGAETKVIKVQMDVSTAAGDWKGFASAKTVNGKPIPLGKIDLVLNVSMNSENVSEAGFRAVINRDRSLLFPRDVFMNGVFFANNEFTLTTNFEMEAGDRNAPPFDVFQHQTGNPIDRHGSLDSNAARGDKDYDGDGQLDVSNPFPFAVTREVTLVGKRMTPNHMKGTFVESIGGLLPENEVIFIEGTFELDRETLEPTKRSVFNERVIANLPIGGSAGEPYRESVITVDEAVSIQGVEVLLDVSFNLPETLKVALTGPDGRSFDLHDGEESDTLANRFTLADYNGGPGDGDWTLRIEWDPSSGERGFFNNWSLNLEGIATYDVSGKVVDTAGSALSNAQVILSGSNVIAQRSTDVAGQFQFTALTENSYTATVSAPGFQSRVLPFFLRDEDLDLGQLSGFGNGLGQIELSRVEVGAAALVAAPYVGSVPLTVRLSASVPRATFDASVGANAMVTWTFGDGVSDGPTAYTPPASGDLVLSTSHTYATPAHLAPSVLLSGDSGSLNLGATVDVYSSQADPSGPVKQVTQYAFIGSVAAPMSNPPEPDGDPMEVSGNTVRQESKRDPAAFDTNRFPAAFSPFEEDTDFFTQEGTPYHAVNSVSANGLYDVYQQPPLDSEGNPVRDRYRMAVTMGGYVFREAPSRASSIVLQASRLEAD